MPKILDVVTICALVSLGCALILNTPAAIIGFGICMIAISFILFLDRKKIDESDLLKQQIQKLSDQVQNVQISLGVTRMTGSR